MTPAQHPTRRVFLNRAAAVASLSAFLPKSPAESLAREENGPLGFPLVDLHAHLDNSSIDQVLPLGKERNVRFGIVEHAGTEENKYPVVLSSNEELDAYLAGLEGKGVYRGVQTEWTDWMHCFSKAALARLDYVITDAMTFPGKNGQRVKLWEPVATDLVDMSNHEAFMDRYVDWYLRILTHQPIDVIVNVSWLPAPLAPQYDALWTDQRIQKVLDAALRYQVAIEISSSYKLPRLPFLKLAKQAGLKFTFGSNGRYPNMGKLDYSIEMAKALELTASDMFLPAPDGKKAVQRRSW